MTATLLAVAPGPYVTLQDLGRHGWRRYGVASAGAMDSLSLRLANALVGNPHDAAALEFAHVGGTWEIIAESSRIAVTGGSFTLHADGVPLAPWQSHRLSRGQKLTIGGTRDAVWGYLAVAGGFDVVPTLGSLATHLRSGLGGTNGRLISEGNALPLRVGHASAGPERRVAAPWYAPGPLRLVLGPQQDFFAPAAVEAFLASKYRVTHRADRMGTWLDGPKIEHAHGFNVLTDGVVPGCVQIPGAGQPLVLLMDCQTVGGYPKLGTIITADLMRFVQIRTGGDVSFTAIGIETAHDLYREHRARLARGESLIQDVPAGG